MWPWFRAAYDQGDVSLFRLLPYRDEGHFMRFVYPLRARAATFLGLLQVVYTLINTLMSVGEGEHYSAFGIFSVSFNMSVYLFLAGSAVWGTPAFLSKVVHAWYAVMVLLRIITILSYAFLDADISLSGIVAYVFYVLVIDLAVGTTMHINFPLLFWLSFVETLFVCFAIVNSSHDESGLTLNATTGVGMTIGFYIIAMWTIHTVQYNTAMMFVWNQKYQHERLEKDAQRRLEELHRLHLANTLHDIGCPLQAFVNGLDEVSDHLKKTAATEGGIDSSLAETLSSMEASITLMSLARRRAIMYAKSYNRVDALMPNREPVHLQYLIGEALKVIKAFARSYNSTVPLRFHIDEDVPDVIMADSDWIMEGLTNYLSNAIKFTESGSIDLKLFLKRGPPIHPLDEGSSVSARGVPSAVADNTKAEDISFVRFEVRDTGRGIPQESVGKLFQPFSQLQTDVAGTGLGLLSVKTKIELLHGAVGVEPNSPNGSIFWFDIPLDIDIPPPLPEDSIEMTSFKPNTAPPRVQPRHVIQTTEETPTRRRSLTPEEIIQQYNIDPSQIKLLLVEDEKMLMRFSSRKFSELGFSVTEATDGAQALDLMQQQSYDIVLMDQNMPQLGGLESIRRFREWQQSTNQRTSSNRADIEMNRSDRKSARTTSFSANSEDNLLVRPANVDVVVNPPEEAPVHSPLIFMMSGSILDADKLEATELGVLDYFEKPLHVSLVAAKVLSHIVQQPTRLDRIQRPSTAETR